MGFHEYDRIRTKNKLYNDAMSLYQTLKNIGMSDNDIVKHIKDAANITTDPYRNDIYMCVERLAKGSVSENHR